MADRSQVVYAYLVDNLFALVSFVAGFALGWRMVWRQSGGLLCVLPIPFMSTSKHLLGLTMLVVQIEVI